MIERAIERRQRRREKYKEERKGVHSHHYERKEHSYQKQACPVDGGENGECCRLVGVSKDLAREGRCNASCWIHEQISF